MEQLYQPNIRFLTLIGMLILGVVIFFVLRLAGRAIEHLYLSSGRLAVLRRVFPAVELSIWVLFILWSLSFVFVDSIYYAISVGLLLGICLLWFSWYAVRDWIAGIVIKLKEPLKTDLQVRIGENTGVVRKVGYLGITLEGEDSSLMKIPFSQIVGQTIEQLVYSTGGSLHKFIVELPATTSSPELATSIRLAILNSPWSPPLKEPQIQLTDSNPTTHRFEVLLPPIDSANAQAIENDVRAQLGL